jgi:hypothetical protein
MRNKGLDRPCRPSGACPTAMRPIPPEVWDGFERRMDYGRNRRNGHAPSNRSGPQRRSPTTARVGHRPRDQVCGGRQGRCWRRVAWEAVRHWSGSGPRWILKCPMFAEGFCWFSHPAVRGLVVKRATDIFSHACGAAAALCGATGLKGKSAPVGDCPIGEVVAMLD